MHCLDASRDVTLLFGWLSFGETGKWFQLVKLSSALHAAEAGSIPRPCGKGCFSQSQLPVLIDSLLVSKQPPCAIACINICAHVKDPKHLAATSLRPRGLTLTWWGYCGLCFWHELTELAHYFSVLFLFCLCLYGPFNCISLNKSSRQFCTFSLCTSRLVSAFLVLSTTYLSYESLPTSDIIHSGWLSSKHN